MCNALLLLLVSAGDPTVAAEPPSDPVRRPDASWGEIFSGPFRSSRLFGMPTADVVGPYQLSLSGEGSLVSESGAFSAAGVIAIGFGDLAQLEYRGAVAVTTLDRAPIILPSAGVQLKAPLPVRRGWPAFGVAFRLGLDREESAPDGSATFHERVSDVYFVSRLRLFGPLERLTLHLGLRLGVARIDVIRGPGMGAARTLVLPAGGWELRATDRTRLVGELSLVPALDPLTPDGRGRIEAKPLGRLGVRWHIHPAVIVDASMGYRIEVERTGSAGGLNELVSWDIRLGAEIFLPWGAMVCRAKRIFCE